MVECPSNWLNYLPGPEVLSSAKKKTLECFMQAILGLPLILSTGRFSGHVHEFLLLNKF